MDYEHQTPLTGGLFHQLMDNLPSGLLVLELPTDSGVDCTEGRIIACNAASEEYFGSKCQDLVGQSIATNLPHCLEAWLAEHEWEICAGEEVASEIYCGRLKRRYDVKFTWLEPGAKCAIILSDITQAHHDSQWRAESEARQTYLTELGDVLSTVDCAEEAKHQAVTLLCEHLGDCYACFVEYDGNRLVSENEADLVVPIIQENKPVAYLLVTPKERRIWTNEEVKLVSLSAQRTWSVVSRLRLMDALQKSEQTAVALAERLKAVDERKNDMIAILSHELRNPMAVISACLDLMELTHKNTEIQHTLDRMREQIDTLTGIVDDLRDVTLLSDGGLELRKEATDLCRVVLHVLQDLDQDFQAKGVKLEYDLPLQPVVVNIDPVRIGQCVDSVTTNALRFSPQGGTVKVTLRYTDNTAAITVQDEGPGIAPGLLENVFDPFAKGSKPRRRAVTGRIGVGLTVVRSVFTAHAGWVKAENVPDGGALFTLTLPLYSIAEERGSVEKEQLTILCIEDNEALAETLQHIFSLYGHETRLAYSGRDGLVKAEELIPDVIFCDLGLEGMNGLDVARKIRANPALNDTLLVALTGYTSDYDKELAKESGFDLYVAKPFQIATIEEILAKVQAAAG